MRIGIHEGEIIFENKDIYGDAVNISSRIQTLGVPGSILFSKKVADEIKNKAEFHTVSLGSFEFKNVIEPIEVISHGKVQQVYRINYFFFNTESLIYSLNDLLVKTTP